MPKIILNRIKRPEILAKQLRSRDGRLFRFKGLSNKEVFSPSKRELDGATFRRGKIVVDFKDQTLQEAGDLREALSTGAITVDDVHAELGEIITGRKEGRSSDREITVFKSVGIAVEDIATAAHVYEQAVAKGLGTDVALNGKAHAE